MHASRLIRLLGMALAALLLVTACSPIEEEGDDTAAPTDAATTEPEEDEEPEPTETEAEPTETEAEAEPTETEAEAEPTETEAAPEVSAAQLRLILERQLGQHAVLAIDAMRQGVTGAEDFEQAGAALARNTEDLTSSIELVYGPEGAQAFNEMWSNHITFFVNYTVGLAGGDQAAQDEALAQLDQYRTDFGAFLETASEGNIQADPIAEGLQVHVDQLIAQIDAYAAGDFETAYAAEQEAYNHMFATAQALAGGITAQFPDRFASSGAQVAGDHGDHQATTIQATGDPIPAVDLQSLVGQQLGEHAQIAIVAMRKGVTGAEDFEPAAASLAANTEELTSSIELVYGPEGAQAFNEMWSNHIAFFVNYTVGLAGGDQAAQDEALAQLDQYRADFSAFLETASEGNIQADPVAESLQMHVDQLIAQIDAYAAGDFETAYDNSYEAYNHMYMTAEALSGGIAAQFPDRFPTE